MKLNGKHRKHLLSAGRSSLILLLLITEKCKKMFDLYVMSNDAKQKSALMFGQKMREISVKLDQN